MKLRLLIICPLFTIVSSLVFAQEAFTPYYVVIGGFRNEENAQKYCTYAHEQNLPAVYAYNKEQQLYYVYVRATQTKDVADEILARMKRGTVFKDAWIFNGVLSGGNVIAREPVVQPADSKPDIQSPADIERPEKVEPKASESVTAPSTEPAVEAPRQPVGRPFVFKLINKETGDALDGLVRLQESERAQQFRGFNGNEKVYVPAPTNKKGKWVVVCQVLGFRHLRMPIEYDHVQELNGVSLGPDQEIIIPFELQPVRRGDYIEMENVKFYNNSALFAPGSERELDQLVAIMTSNPDYQVRLHGHTNGNDARDIVSLGTSTDFFTPNTSNDKSHASAKELALFRADLVKAYLVSKGIDASRISTKGEGGTQMIYSPKGTLAGLNDRVEVEIRKH